MALGAVITVELVEWEHLDGLTPCCFLPARWRVHFIMAGALWHNDWCENCGHRLA